MIPNHSIGRVFRIIKFLAYKEEKEYFSLNDVSKGTLLNISTTYRFLENLIQLGLIEKNSKNKKYRLTLELYNIGNSILYKRNNNILSHIIESIKVLSKKYNETVNLYTFEKNKSICIYRLENYNVPISYSIKIGSQHPAYCTAAGKVFLASRDEKFIDSYFRKVKLKKYTKNTQIEINKIKKELILVKKNNYAFDKEEYIEGINCIAVPIIGIDNTNVYAISIAVPVSRIKCYDISDLIKNLLKLSRICKNNDQIKS